MPRGDVTARVYTCLRKLGFPPDDMAAEQAPVAECIALTATTEFACYPPTGEQACWATASLKAPFYELTVRAPVDIVAVIDKSGSMHGAKLDLVKKTLLFVIDQCKEWT